MSSAVTKGWRASAGAVLLTVAGVAAAQNTAPQAPPQASCTLVRDAAGHLVPDPSCPNSTAPAAPAPSAPATQRFPFPGSGGDNGGSAAPGATAPAAPSAGQPANRRFPYPGEAAPAAADAPSARPVPGQPPLQDAGSSGSSSDSSGSAESDSSSSSSSNSASPAGNPADPEGNDPDDPMADPAKIAARRRARRKPAAPPQPPSAREQEDVQVAGFYQNDGNFRGAYDRAKDAVSIDKDDPAAHLAVADAARKLGKLDEAEQEYKQTLALDPVPKVRKQAEKALNEMSGGG